MISYEFLRYTDPALSQYLNQINKLLPQLSLYSKKLTKPQLLKALLCGNLLLAKDTDFTFPKVVGVALLVITHKLTQISGQIEDVVVDQLYRNQKIGRALITNLIILARKKHLGYIELTSSPHRLAANHLYISLGFQLRKTNVYRLKIPD